MIKICGFMKVLQEGSQGVGRAFGEDLRCRRITTTLVIVVKAGKVFLHAVLYVLSRIWLKPAI
jgi:hypothetical protein